MLALISPMMLGIASLCAVLSKAQQAAGNGKAQEATVSRLASEVRTRGWIVFCARSDKGDWDLFVCRPDGSAQRNLTSTPEYNEAAPQFSRDGRKLLYRRLGRHEAISGNNFGTQGELVLARADGADPVVLGKSGEHPWASWSPDGSQIACLSIKGVSFVELAGGRVVRTLPRKGFFQQLTWSPDGKWLVGVANAFGTSWSVARMDARSGEAQAVSRIDCCTPDWFPDSRQVIFSNRPPGQQENDGNGWTQLWMADPDGSARRLVYGEDGRHVYGGNVSPDGAYVTFTGNIREDGDPEHQGAPMGLLRLADAPIIGGTSKELRKLHPGARSGPVLVLPVGWEPCWTFAEIAAPAPAPARGAEPPSGLPNTAEKTQPRASDDVAALAREVRDRGWIAFSARTDRGDWDLFRMRPDGSQRQAVADTPRWHEAGVRFSPDGGRMLYYRIPISDAVDNNTYGTFELVIAAADGGSPESYGHGFLWASWGPDGSQLACLDQRGIHIIDVANHREVRKLPRKGLIQQLIWSPDGKRFVGTANGLGPYWNIGRMDAQSGVLNAVSETERYNCTPDWMPDSQHILYSRGITPEVGGWAELWLAGGDGKARRVLYAEKDRHIYGGCAAPDGKYLLFTRSELDLGRVDNSRTRMAVIRMADTPMRRGPAGAAAPRPLLGLGAALDLCRSSPTPTSGGARVKDCSGGVEVVDDGAELQRDRRVYAVRQSVARTGRSGVRVRLWHEPAGCRLKWSGQSGREEREQDNRDHKRTKDKRISVLREIDLPGAFRIEHGVEDADWFQPAGHRESRDRDGQHGVSKNGQDAADHRPADPARSENRERVHERVNDRKATDISPAHSSRRRLSWRLPGNQDCDSIQHTHNRRQTYHEFGPEPQVRRDRPGSPESAEAGAEIRRVQAGSDHDGPQHADDPYGTRQIHEHRCSERIAVLTLDQHICDRHENCQEKPEGSQRHRLTKLQPDHCR
jgi:Tol biopolymer transport system component